MVSYWKMDKKSPLHYPERVLFVGAHSTGHKFLIW